MTDQGKTAKSLPAVANQLESSARQDAMVRVLPAAAYDFLAWSAARYGGVGAGELYEAGAPFCIIGHAHPFQYYRALRAIGVGVTENDRAVRRVNRRRRWYRRLLPWIFAPDSRITFAELCAELRIVRGDL